MRVPRKTKKAIKNTTLIYDLDSSPKEYGIDLETLMSIYKYQGIILYCSTKGTKPYIINKSFKRTRVLVKS